MCGPTPTGYLILPGSAQICNMSELLQLELEYFQCEYLYEYRITISNIIILMYRLNYINIEYEYIIILNSV
jgi:hypothetical protein